MHHKSSETNIKNMVKRMHVQHTIGWHKVSEKRFFKNVFLPYKKVGHFIDEKILFKRLFCYTK